MTKTGRQLVINVAATCIAGGLLLMLSYALHRLSSQEVPMANRDALMVVIGILSANFATVVNFFFGSSSESKRQTEAVADLASHARSNSARPDVVIEPGETATVKADS